MTRTSISGLLSAVLGAAQLAPAMAQTPAEFYKGKTISVLVGIEQGTGFDLYGRTLAQHLGRHVPGNPTVIVNNMPGASGLVAFNWLANVAPRDGSVFATASFSVPFEPLFGNDSARFRGTDFNWIGNMDSGVSVCLARADSGVAQWSDLMHRELTIGAAGRAGPLSQIPRALIALGGVKLNLVEGYVGSASIKLATERKEVQGVCGLSLSTMRSQWTDLTASGAVRMILQIGPKPDPDLGSLAHVYEFAKSAAERQVYSLIFGPQGLGRAFAAPRDVPADRVRELREAFAATMKDERFLEDARKAKLDLKPQTGDEVQAFVESLYASPPDVLQQARRVLGR
jgi:tripartite-type tricarboxylate transporter receptor subunit TctC